MNSCCNTLLISSIACALFDNCDKDDIAVLAADLVQLGDTLAAMIVREEVCGDSDSSCPCQKHPHHHHSQSSSPFGNLNGLFNNFNGFGGHPQHGSCGCEHDSCGCQHNSCGCEHNSCGCEHDCMKKCDSEIEAQQTQITDENSSETSSSESDN